MDLNLVILSLEYTYLIHLRAGVYESSAGLWQNHLEWSKALIPYGVMNQHPDTVRIIDNVARLRDTVRVLNHNGVSDTNHIKLVEPQLANQLITVSINGNETFINNSRTEILRAYRHVGHKKIALAPHEAQALRSFGLRLDSIATKCGVEIVMSTDTTDFKGECTAGSTPHVYVLGGTDSVAYADTEVRILIDTMLKGCFVDRVRAPLLMIPALGGAGLANFAELARELNVSIYLPYLMTQVFDSQLMEHNGDMSIWLTAPCVAEIVNTKRVLEDLVAAVDPAGNELFTQHIDVPKEKLDLIALYRQHDVLATMFKHGTYVQLPSLGEARNNTVVVQGPTQDAVNDTAAELSALSCDFYNLQVKFLRGAVSADFEYYLINLVNRKKTCVLTFNEHGMCIVGSKTDMHALLRELVAEAQSLAVFAQFLNKSDAAFQMVLSMELSNDQKEFLSGKKNGKIIKILNQLGHVPVIRFKPLNNFNFLINLSIRVAAGIKDKPLVSLVDLLIRTVTLIELELPAEMQFNIPEVFHKSIIGNGGSIIQSIMKKYNVFIKFSSSSRNPRSPKKDARAPEKILYLFKRNNNVLIKCPSKNQRNIALAKYEVDQLVEQCCANSAFSANGISVIYNTVKFRLLKSHYLLLIRKHNYNLEFINELECDYSTFIQFPSSVSAFGDESSLTFSIKGNDARARQCAEKLASLLPQSYEFQIPYCPGKFEELFNDRALAFRETITIPFRLILGIELVAHSATDSMGSPFHQVILSSYEEENLQRAVCEMTHYLRENRFLILDKNGLDYNPIVLVEEVSSPARVQYSPSKPRTQRSPQRSPTRPLQKSKNNLPPRSPDKTVKTITNHGASTLKIPVLTHLSAIPMPMPNLGWN